MSIEHGATSFDLLLKGNLDKVEFNPDGTVNVVDYKTGKPKSRNDILGNTSSSDGDYGRQLVFYKLLLDRFAAGKYRMVSGDIDFIEPDERDRYHKEHFEVTENDVRDLEKTITTAAQEIYDLSFWEKTCNQKVCDYCDLKNIMLSERKVEA